MGAQVAATAAMGGFVSAAVNLSPERYQRYTVVLTPYHVRGPNYLATCCGSHVGMTIFSVCGNTNEKFPGMDWNNPPFQLVKNASHGSTNRFSIAFNSTLKAYTYEGPFYKEINQALNDDDAGQLQVYAGAISNIRTEIKQLLGQKGALERRTVFRGMCVSTSALKQYYVGKMFVWAAFTSTSCDEKTAREFTKRDWEKQKAQPHIVDIHQVVFTIYINEDYGNNQTYAVEVPHSCVPGEQEVLLYPYSGFHITSIEVRQEIYYIHMKTCDTLIVERNCGDVCRPKSIANGLPFPTAMMPTYVSRS